MKIKPSCNDRLNSVSGTHSKIIFLNFIPLVRLIVNSAYSLPYGY